jgi:hypothetical protein
MKSAIFHLEGAFFSSALAFILDSYSLVVVLQHQVD